MIRFTDRSNEIKEKLANFGCNVYKDFLAVQVTLKDLNEVFYVEIKGGNFSVEPHEYNDRQANIIIISDKFIKMINGKLNPVLAFTTGQLKVEGDVGKASEFSKLLKR